MSKFGWSKFGWSLPPDCSTLPGENIQEQKDQALFDKIYEILDRMSNGQHNDTTAQEIFKLCGDIYDEGYTAGSADECHLHEEEKRAKEQGYDGEGE